MIEKIKNLKFVIENNLEVSKIKEDKKYLLTGKEKTYIIEFYSILKFSKIKKMDSCLCEIKSKIKELITYVEIGQIDESKCYRIIENVNDITSELMDKDSYDIGLKIGKFIKIFHEYFKTVDCGRWSKHYTYRINKVFHEYGIGQYKGELDYILFDFIDATEYLLKERHCTTIMGINSAFEINVTKDFRFQILEDYKIQRSDPYFEFRGFNKSFYKKELLLTGIIDGYFDFKPSRIFFKLLALYTIIENIYDKFKKTDNRSVETARVVVEEISRVYDNFNSIYPTWYLRSKDYLKDGK